MLSCSDQCQIGGALKQMANRNVYKRVPIRQNDTNRRHGSSLTNGRSARENTVLPEGTNHSLRHTFITYALKVGVPDSKVIKMAGHAKLYTPGKYTRVFERLLPRITRDLRNASNTLSSIPPSATTGHVVRSHKKTALALSESRFEIWLWS